MFEFTQGYIYCYVGHVYFMIHKVVKMYMELLVLDKLIFLVHTAKLNTLFLISILIIFPINVHRTIDKVVNNIHYLAKFYKHKWCA